MNYMNGSDSSEILTKILIKKGLKHIPFYLVTAYEDDASIKKLTQGNIDGVLVKPLRYDTAESIMNRII